jgi:NADH-quinone oxidoreductase subunit G
MLAHRVRKAALAGAKIAFLNPARFEYNFPVAAFLDAGPARQVSELAAILKASLAKSQKAPAHLASLVRAAKVADRHRAIAAALQTGERRAVWLGELALRHPAYSDLRALAAALALVTGASWGVIAEGSNAAGAYLAGAVPHRDVGARAIATPGLSAWQMLKLPLSAYVLLGVEPWVDALDPHCVRTLAAADLVVAITPFVSDLMSEVAHVLLPMGSFAETAGTYVNLEGLWQSFTGAAAPLGEARPGWKVLRVLGNVLGLAAFEYQSADEVREEVRRASSEPLATAYAGQHAAAQPQHAVAVVDVPMYQVDALVRRAPALQGTHEGRMPATIYE